MATHDKHEKRGNPPEARQTADQGGAQGGRIGSGDQHQQQEEADILGTGGMGTGEQGQGKQRRPGGSSRDGKQQR